ncbi:exodeoxyribonuclease III [Curvibacter sp. HBC28]|uniref:Exodeoxyribonuclease III n=1 Tax=Curvibacter microcysteis TaxID=3026419 RepID=A0ABT5MJH2_9BURK|nr:exodeoxyribonuclease III [Curvibacter sp. HBC28]MDD0815325.1 exodeoxyribonuclease III [Curvibacter sp. HBC28]
MKVATWNVNSLSVRLPQVLDWLAANPVDALCLQELKLSDDKFPVAALQEAGYHSAFFGQKTYNGVAILSRSPLSETVRNIPGFEDEQARIIAGTLQGEDGPVRIVNGYFVNGQAPDSDKFVYKMRWLQALRDWLHSQLEAHPRLVLLGDFNITADDRDTWDPEGLRETIHHTTAERDELKALLALGLHDAFRLFEQAEKSYSWWDYREFAFRRNRGLRIDYALVSEALKPQVSACVIDRAPRKNERPSDHTPVVVTF